jgi:hypothetical protein
MMGQANAHALTLSIPVMMQTSGGWQADGAPYFSIFGAFFPAWMFCALVSVLAAIGVRLVFVASGLSRLLPFQLLVCSSLGLCAGLCMWGRWFGP